MTLEEIGRAAFGDRWRGRMAEALGVSDRTLDRWAAGSHNMPDGAWDDLVRIVTERRPDLLDQLFTED